MSIAAKQEEFFEELALFQTWEEKYEYIIGLGRKLTPMTESERTPDKLIEGCQAKIWLDAILDEGKIHYRVFSDSIITKGIAAVFVKVLDGETPDNILTTDMSFVDKTGLREHLVSTRANALSLMATQMKQRALLLSTTQA